MFFVYDLADLAGILDPNKRDFGSSSNTGLKGLVNLASGFKTGEILTGVAKAKDLFDNRLIASLDPGLVNLAATTTFAYGQYNRESRTFNGTFAKNSYLQAF